MKRMEDPLLVTLLAARASNDVLEVLSHTSLWSLIAPQLHNQHFWYMRTEAAFNLPPELSWERNAKENWNQIYNILMSSKIGNPFSNTNSKILEANDYNAVAIRYLLKMGFDPGVGNNVLFIEAIQYASSEVVKILLADPRTLLHITDYVSLWNVLWILAKRGQADSIELLLNDERIKPVPRTDGDTDVLLMDILTTAIIHNQVEVAKLVFKLRNFDHGSYLRTVRIAIKNSSLDVLVLLLEEVQPSDIELESLLRLALKIGSRQVIEELLMAMELEETYQYRAWTIVAIELDQPESILTLAYNDDMTEEYMLSTVSTLGGPKMMKILLENESFSTEAINNAIRGAVRTSRVEVLPLLLADTRASGSGRLIAELLNERPSPSTAIILARSRQVELEDLSQPILEFIIGLRQKSILDSNIARRIRSIHGDFEVDHYDMLLREIVIKQLDLGYYIDWLTARVSNQYVSRHLRELIASAAASVLSNEEIVHTSAMFTAYSGFLLLANSKRDKEATMNSIEMEEGVTDEGLRLARMLIDSFKWSS